jgi:hypothetical protein
MEWPHIFDEFFNEISVWFLIFMLVSFMLGVLTTWWVNSRTIRILRKQVLRLKQEIVTVREVEAAPNPEESNPSTP